ncbi:uncharacterized protein LOC9633891 [Selaginella moellendorffii]|uniref:uncharacterized protein LOC9633891 n=1 Tax=Selaginella moellendorffii TaxID=88036 RepID=UPI000D1D0047|nr:uncharacterized protein LOC9633891 [Selaginella moellendorffii]|eukprot:XP_024542446.1 uncharacterized protein LOC9633891 [Selaginella moellendorffii]
MDCEARLRIREPVATLFKRFVCIARQKFKEEAPNFLIWLQIKFILSQNEKPIQLHLDHFARLLHLSSFHDELRAVGRDTECHGVLADIESMLDLRASPSPSLS